MTLFQVKVLQKKFTLLHADFSKIVLKYSNKVHLLCYLTPQTAFKEWKMKEMGWIWKMHFPVTTLS
jgi:hypothetical protein